MSQISEIRPKLLENLAQFIPACITIPGIVRISLIGSLCTTKPDPKDIDLNDLNLTRQLVLSPPLELWPTILARISIPQDVDTIIIQPLQQILQKSDKSIETPLKDCHHDINPYHPL